MSTSQFSSFPTLSALSSPNSNRYSTESVDEETNLSADTLTDHIMQAESLYNDDDDEDEDDFNDDNSSNASNASNDFNTTTGSSNYSSSVEYNIRQNNPSSFDRLEHLSRFYKSQTDDKGAVRESMEIKANIIKGMKDNIDVEEKAKTDNNNNNNHLRFSTTSSIHSVNTDTHSVNSGSYNDTTFNSTTNTNTNTSTSTSTSTSLSPSHLQPQPSSSFDLSSSNYSSSSSQVDIDTRASLFLKECR
ncbi:hypothetical protein TL16_g02854 [Triparma laevis f. inornata]|uniref:Uncharacterized protein n=1 Tax=Triparma laevis f. inornata TaxID=1714386 RepID=A0A9W7DYK7_9STRA|nr:hypothetical protein TL16_g02854 [Triparma laevis f. inornata]